MLNSFNCVILIIIVIKYLLFFCGGQVKAEAPACALTARRPAEMLIMNKVLGFHNNLQVGRTPLSEPELDRGVRTAENTPAQRVRDGQKERKQTDRRFLRGGGRSAPPYLLWY